MTPKTSITPLVVSLNSNKVLEFIRDRQLTQRQINDLNKLDSKLDSGITFAGDFVQAPNSNDKAIFMANNLALALDTNNDSITALSCAYLATRYPELKQLKISSNNEHISIELVYDKEYTEQAPVKFVSKKDLI